MNWLDHTTSVQATIVFAVVTPIVGLIANPAPNGQASVVVPST